MYDELLFALRQRDREIEAALYHRELHTIYTPHNGLVSAKNATGDWVSEFVPDHEAYTFDGIRAAVNRAAQRLRVRRALRRGMRRARLSPNDQTRSRTAVLHCGHRCGG